MAISSFFLGQPSQIQEFPLLNPQQQGLQSASINKALSLLQGSPNYTAGFEPFAQKARTQFQTQTIPGLAERFTAMGGGQRSSAFQGALGQAASGLEESLAALGSQYGQQQQGLDQQLLQSLWAYGLRPTLERLYQPSEKGFVQSGAENILPIILRLLPLLAGA